MGSDPAPHHVGLTGLDLWSELPGGPPVGREGDLHDVACDLNALYPKAPTEAPARLQVLDEAGNDSTEPLLVGSTE